MRIIVLRNKKNEVVCKPMTLPVEWYEKDYEVITVVNKLFNPYHVTRIYAYFKQSRG